MTFYDGSVTAPRVAIQDARFPFPFRSGCEYNVPARGKWNIVHQGMLLPESHQIFLCARGCLRGVIMTAAEMNALDRISWVAFTEEDLALGKLEEIAIEGVCDILAAMRVLPKAVLLFNSCVHRFSGFDFSLVRDAVVERFPTVRILECFMNPTMRKTDLPEDQLLKRQIYSLIDAHDCPQDNGVNIIGCDRPTLASTELMRCLSGHTVRDISTAPSFAAFQEQARSRWNICYLPEALPAAESLSSRLQQTLLYVPLSYGEAEILHGLETLQRALGSKVTFDKEPMYEALSRLKHSLGERPIAIDYTSTPRPLSLARLLLQQGLHVQTVYADAFIKEEQEDFFWLQRSCPSLQIASTVHVSLVRREAQKESAVLAIGQKAAFLEGTKHFVNIVSGGGWHGFDGICHMASAMEEAAAREQDTRSVIQHKGLGCASCVEIKA